MDMAVEHPYLGVNGRTKTSSCIFQFVFVHATTFTMGTLATREYDDMHVDALLHQLLHQSPTAKNLVVRMRCHNQDCTLSYVYPVEKYCSEVYPDHT